MLLVICSLLYSAFLQSVKLNFSAKLSFSAKLLPGKASFTLEAKLCLSIILLSPFLFNFWANIFSPFYFAVHYSPGPLNSLFGSARGLDGNINLQFQGQASLFSERSTPGRNVLIHTGDQRTMRSILLLLLQRTATGRFIGSLTSCSGMRRLTQIINCWPGKGNGSSS